MHQTCHVVGKAYCFLLLTNAPFIRSQWRQNLHCLTQVRSEPLLPTVSSTSLKNVCSVADRAHKTNTNAIEQLTFSTTGWSDWNWHRQTITLGLAFTVLCVLLSYWISATVTSDANRKSQFSHAGTTREVTSSSSSCSTLPLSHVFLTFVF